jgi:glycosyltransferase involved in cell wall biosynthesis
MYLEVARLMAGRSGYDGRDDWVIANSQFTADVLKARLGIVCRQVLYPPVVCDAPNVPWAQRENGFVCLGRVSHEKRIERVIDIVARVRQMGHDVHLHVIGPIGDDAYGRMISATIADNSGWCFADGSMRGREKFELLARHKWAIHARDGEAFGIAVAEQVRSGCVPFVPQAGGPAEIVAEPSLCYTDEADAIAKIDALLRDEGRQAQVRVHLAERAKLFTTERFMAEFRQLVFDFASRTVKKRG